jgi:zinc transport system substrate-binding protein
MTVSSRHAWGIATLVALIAVLCLATACTESAADAGASEDTLTVVTTVPPMGWLVEQIGGENVDVVVMVEPGEDPHTYEPSPADMQAMGDADAYVTVGLEFEEAWIPRFTEVNPDMVIIDAAAEVEKLAGDDEHADEDHADEEHADDEHAHDHGEGDPHVWTSPAAMTTMGYTLADEFAALDAENAEAYESNALVVGEDATDLDAKISAALASSESGTFMVFHPAWGYFAREYGLEQIAIEVGGQEPSAAELAQLVETARDEGISVILVQPSHSTRTADLIAQEIDAEVAVADPLAADWLTSMEQVAETFGAALE